MTAPGDAALAAIDQALAGRPHKDDHAFAAAMDHLCVMRDEMIARVRTDGGSPATRTQLEHVNSVLTVVLGGYFPLGAVPWHEVEKARGWLREVLAAS